MNWLSITLAALTALILRVLWFELLFKKTLEASNQEVKSALHPALLYAVSFALAFLIAIGLWKQIIGLHTFVDTLKGGNGVISEYPFFHGALHGFQNSIYFGAVSVLLSIALFDLRSWKYILVQLGYWIAIFSLMGGVVGFMG